MATRLAISTNDEACERMDATMLGKKEMLCHEDMSPIRDVCDLSSAFRAMGAADSCEAPSDFSQPRRRKSGRPSEIGTPESRRSAAPMFDTPTATTHPRGVRSILKRVAAVVCVLT